MTISASGLSRGTPGRRYRPTGRGHAVAPYFVAATASLLVGSAWLLAQQVGAPLPGDLANRWPPTHLTLVGGVTQLILGSMAFFAVTLLQVEPPPLLENWLSWGLVNVGAAGLVGGALAGSLWLLATGGSLVLAALLTMGYSVWRLWRRSLGRPDPTLLYYLAAAAFLALGIVLGLLMVLGGPLGLVLPYGGLRLAHLHVNLNGWVTITIVGTLRLFFGSTLGAPARHLASPRWELAPLALGVLCSALGWLVPSVPLLMLGGAAQAVGVAACCQALWRQWRLRPRPTPLAARHLAAAGAWLAMLTLVGGFAVAGRGAWPVWANALVNATTTAALVGFIGQTVLGGWTHLFSVVAALPPGRLPLLPHPLRPRLRAALVAWPSLQFAVANAGVAGLVLGQALAPVGEQLAAGLTRGGQVALAMVLALVVIKAGSVGWLVLQAWRAPRPTPSA